MHATHDVGRGGPNARGRPPDRSIPCAIWTSPRPTIGCATSSTEWPPSVTSLRTMEICVCASTPWPSRCWTHPGIVVWALIGLLIDRPLLTAASIYFALAMPVMLVCLARTKAFEPIVRVLLVIGLSYVVLGYLALGGMQAGGASLIWGLVAPVSAVLYFDRGSSLRWFVGFGAIVVGGDRLRSAGRQPAPASWSSPPSWLFAYNLLGSVPDRAAADPVRRRPAPDGTEGVAAPAAGHAAGQDRRAAGGRRAA